jgi:hypothetical protein
LKQRTISFDDGIWSHTPSSQATQQTCLDHRSIVSRFRIIVDGRFLLATERITI